MNAAYRFVRSIQDTAQPIRSKPVAIVAYAVLATALAWVLPTLGQRIATIWHRAPWEFPLLGALYGHCKWSIAVDRYWWRPRRTYDGEQEQS